MLTGFIELVETDKVDSGDDDLDHYYCELCHPEGDKALCGSRLEDANEVEDEEWEADCIVCREMTRCPECGVSYDLGL